MVNNLPVVVAGKSIWVMSAKSCEASCAVGCRKPVRVELRRMPLSIRTLVPPLLVVLGLPLQHPAICQIIAFPADGSLQERLAAKEVRRYTYLRTGQLLALREVSSLPAAGDLILVADDDHPAVLSLMELINHEAGPGGFIIKSINTDSRQILVITGDVPISVLYGAYRYAEHLGVGFGLTEDIIPEEETATLQAKAEGLNPIFDVA